jgi:short-subunit dehydrogenase
MKIVADLCKVELQKYEEIAQGLDGIDLAIVVNNAGVSFDKEFAKVKPENIREMTIVNTYPYVLMTRALLPLLKKRGDKKSCIVNLSSSASF